jgi:hypothetical protein
MGPGLVSWDFSISAKNCGHVSSDVHMLDIYVRILYKFIFCIYNFVRHLISNDKTVTAAVAAIAAFLAVSATPS